MKSRIVAIIVVVVSIAWLGCLTNRAADPAQTKSDSAAELRVALENTQKQLQEAVVRITALEEKVRVLEGMAAREARETADLQKQIEEIGRPRLTPLPARPQ